MTRAERAASFFSPPGRRWPEGSDEGATVEICGELAPSSSCRGLLPGGEKKQVALARSHRRLQRQSAVQPDLLQAFLDHDVGVDAVAAIRLGEVEQLIRRIQLVVEGLALFDLHDTE